MAAREPPPKACPNFVIPAKACLAKNDVAADRWGAAHNRPYGRPKPPLRFVTSELVKCLDGPRPLWLFYRREPDAERGGHPRRLCRFKLGDHIRDKENIRSRKTE